MKKALITKVTSIVKKHFYVFLLLLLTIIFFSSILTGSKTLNNIHYVNDMTFQSENIRAWLKDGGAFPLWTPYFYSGQPFMAIPEYYLFDLNFIYIFLTGNIFLSMNLAVISYFFLAGFGMYLLVNRITDSQPASFIAAIIFMFNGLMHKFMLGGHLNIVESYALLPFTFYFVYKALHEKKFSQNAIYAALTLALMVYSGGMIYFLYTGVLIGTYMIWFLWGKNISQRLIKAGIIGTIILACLSGTIALKLLPVVEFTSLSSRAAGVSYQEFLGNPVSFSDLFNILIVPSTNQPFVAFVGFTAFILAALGLMSWKKKIVLYSLIIILIGVLLATGSFLAELFFKLPGFDKMRHIERALVFFVFAIPILASFGVQNVVEIIRKQQKNIKPIFIFIGITIIILIELVAMQKFPKSVDVENPLEIPTVAEIAKDTSDYRIATYGMSTPIGASGYNYYSQLKIPEAKGGGGIWMNDYVRFLAISQQVAPAKLFGVLSSKYLISDKEIPDAGLELVTQFDKCTECIIWEAYGPYLYKNNQAVPRAFQPSQTVLLIGSRQEQMDVGTNLLANVIDPSSTGLIHGKQRIAEYSDAELNTFDTLLLLTGSVSELDIPKLRKYVENGGKILPDIINGETSLSPEQIAAINIGGGNTEIKVKDISVNEYEIQAPNPGWVVLSERFAHFPGWTATLNDVQIPIEIADTVISAVYVSEPSTINFKYYPDSFKKGKLITLITVFIIIVYLVSMWLIGRRSKKSH